MKITKIVLAAAAAVLFLPGCMTEEPIKERATDARIELVNSSSFKVELLKSSFFINDDGLLTVDASALLSRTGSFRWVFAGDPQITVWYHFDWIDAEGNICPPQQCEMTALPGNIVDFHGVAPSEKYVSYRLTVSLTGPETKEEAEKQQAELKKASSVKAEAVPAESKEKAPAKAEVKAAEKAPAKTEAVPAKTAEKAPAKQQKLTEPFN